MNAVRRKRRAAAWIEGASKVRLVLLKATRSELQLRTMAAGRDCFVYLDLLGAGRHHCTCTDWRNPCEVLRRPPGMFCEHIVAAALQEGRRHLLVPLLVK